MIMKNETREGTIVVKQLIEIICHLLNKPNQDSEDSRLKEKLSVLSQISKSLKSSSHQESSG